MGDDDVFKALADPSRRALLDTLFQRDGQTLGELSATLASDMGRFGVMKHLRVLEDSGLVIARRAGREKHHYLNPVPIRQIHDRWINKYRLEFASALVGLKKELERQGGRKVTEELKQIYQVFIQATPDKVWEAITSSEYTTKYWYGSAVQSDFKPGSEYKYTTPDGSQVFIEGKVLEADPPRKLVQTYNTTWGPLAGEKETTLTWELEEMGPATRLTVTHAGFQPGSKVFEALKAGGWAMILSGLKTVLETGKPLVVQQPAWSGK